MTPSKNAFHNVEMKIEVTNRCLFGRCTWCSPLFRPAAIEAEKRAFLRSLDQHLDDYLSGGGRKVILTGGGEPIDAPGKLFGALELIARKKVEYGIDLELLTVYTNGVSLLKRVSPNAPETYLDRLVRLGVRDMNLSVHGGTVAERTATSGEYMGSIDFETLIPRMVRSGVRVMTRTTLTRDGINTVEKMGAFARHMDSMGVGIVYFSDLFSVPIRGKETTPGSKKVLQRSDEQRIDFGKLLAQLRSSTRFTLLSESTRHNHQGRTFEFRQRGVKARILLGDLRIGDESEEVTYAYVKPDGSMGGNNNARSASVRRFADTAKAYLRRYRPGRDDI